MSGEQPTGDAGASVTERLEAMLGGEQQQPEEQAGDEAAPEKQPAVEKPAGDAQDEPEGPQYELSDIAKVLGLDETLLDVDEDGSLKIKTKIDGVEGAAKLQDFVKSYQLQGHIDAKVRQVAEQEKAHAERVTKVEQFAQNKIQELTQLAQFAEQALMQEAGQVDWDRLVMEDPIGYQQKRHAFDAQQQRIGHLKQQAAQKARELDQARAWQFQQTFEREAGRLTSLVPEWKDRAAVDAGLGEIHKWLTTKGADPQKGLLDAGLLAVLHAAMKADQTAPKVAATEKKVRLAPKLVRPGSGTTVTERKQESVRGLKQEIRNSGGKKGIEAWLLATGKV